MHLLDALIFEIFLFTMDPESKWAKSTESRLEMFLDDYLIKSSAEKVRLNSQKLLLSLFKKGNREQQAKMDYQAEFCVFVGDE